MKLKIRERDMRPYDLNQALDVGVRGSLSCLTQVMVIFQSTSILESQEKWELIFREKEQVVNLEKQLESTHRFIGEVAQELNNPEDRERAYRLVRTGFSVLRDRLTIEESFNLLSQLPFFLKAVYVDGWRPQAKTRRVKHLSELLEEARKVEPRTSARDLGNDERTEEALRAVFRVLKRQITEGESSHIEASFPEELREFWVDA